MVIGTGWGNKILWLARTWYSLKLATGQKHGTLSTPLGSWSDVIKSSAPKRWISTLTHAAPGSHSTILVSKWVGSRENVYFSPMKMVPIQKWSSSWIICEANLHWWWGGGFRLRHWQNPAWKDAGGGAEPSDFCVEYRFCLKVIWIYSFFFGVLWAFYI